MPIVSSGALLDVLREHRILSTEQLAQAADLVRGRCGEARTLAKMLGQRGWLTIYQINQLLAGNGKDLVLGGYLILDRLGQGGLSQVFKARHVQNDWIVALKVIRQEAMADDDGREQFLHEMEAMARLEHPNIVQFCDLDQAGDIFYFAMEFVEGTDLQKQVDLCGPMPAQEACDYIRQAALGLQHAHERNLVHRDIKPANLFLTQENVRVRLPGKNGKKGREVVKKRPLIKILDWGLAGLRYPGGEAGPERVKSMAKGIVGTADFLSPEQARNAHTVDIRGDIYSLGCSLYFLLAGQPPFPSGTLMHKILQHQQTRPTPVEKFRDDLSEEVIDILARMMAKDPIERFQTPAAIALALAPSARQEIPASEAPKQSKPYRGPARVKDETPLPIELGTPGRTSKAGRQRGNGDQSDTSYPRQGS